MACWGVVTGATQGIERARKMDPLKRIQFFMACCGVVTTATQGVERVEKWTLLSGMQIVIACWGVVSGATQSIERIENISAEPAIAVQPAQWLRSCCSYSSRRWLEPEQVAEPKRYSCQSANMDRH